MGARTLQRWLSQPLRSLDRLESRLERVDQLSGDALNRAELRSALKELPDLERIVARVGQALATPRELRQLGRALRLLPSVHRIAARWEDLATPPLPSLVQDLDHELLAALVDEVPATFREGGVFRSGYDPALDAIKEGSREAREWIARLEEVERERTGIRSLRVGFNQVFGYYIEISHANRVPVPDDYRRKQTLVNGERYITPDLKEKESLVLNARSATIAREQALFRRALPADRASARLLLELAAWVGELDALAALAELAVRQRWVRPTLRDEPGIQINAGRHPLVELALGPGRFVPNDLPLEPPDARIVLLTGPNMAGKSTYLRQAGIIVLLAQIGSFVPADERRHRSAATASSPASEPTTSWHAGFRPSWSRWSRRLTSSRTPRRRSLLIFDEVGRGTSTYDGVSIAQAILEYLHDAPHLQSLTVFATHYHELTALSQRLPALKNYRVEVREEGERIVFLHEVVEGGADRSYGLHVATLAGIPRQVVLRARQILEELEGERPLERPAGTAQLQLPISDPIVQELQQLDLERISPREALDKLFAWQAQRGRS